MRVLFIYLFIFLFNKIETYYPFFLSIVIDIHIIAHYKYSFIKISKKEKINHIYVYFNEEQKKEREREKRTKNKNLKAFFMIDLFYDIIINSI